MTLLELKPSIALRRSRARCVGAGLAIVPPVVVALAFLPLLVLQARSLWDRPHLQAFPLALAGGAGLARLATRRLGALTPGARGWSLAALGVCGALLALATLSTWPWLGTLAAMWMLLAASYSLGGMRLLVAVLPAWAFVALAVLPPNLTEMIVVTRLQALVTMWASPMLNALGVLHVTEGNVIRVPGRMLLVEQACSGVRSLLFVLGTTLFFVVWSGRKPLRGAFLLMAAGLWVLLGNTARVTIVAYVMARWKIDLSTGVRHEALGLAILATVLGLTLSTDQFFRFLAALTKVQWIQPLIQERPAGAVDRDEDVEDATTFPDFRLTWLGSWTVATAFGALGGAQVVWLAPRLVDALTPDRVVERLEVLNENSLPDHYGTARRDAFELKARDTGSDFGNFARTWRYRGTGRAASVSVDYPFRGWHELTDCYQSVGWTLRGRAIHTLDAGVYVEAAFDQPDGRRAVLLFGLDDQNGAPMEPRPFGSPLAYLRNRLAVLATAPTEVGRRLATRYEAMPRGYQVQLLIEAETPLSVSEWTEARAFFDEIRMRIRHEIAAGSKPIQAGGAS